MELHSHQTLSRFNKGICLEKRLPRKTTTTTRSVVQRERERETLAFVLYNKEGSFGTTVNRYRGVVLFITPFSSEYVGHCSYHHFNIQIVQLLLLVAPSNRQTFASVRTNKHKHHETTNLRMKNIFSLERKSLCFTL